MVFVGHSMSAMVGVLAAAAAPNLFARLVLVSPSPRYVNDGDYVGGFSMEDTNDMLESLESNYLGWSSAKNAGRDDIAGFFEQVMEEDSQRAAQCRGVRPGAHLTPGRWRMAVA